MSPALEKDFLAILTTLTLNPSGGLGSIRKVMHLPDSARQELLELADSHHVVIRVLQPIAEGATLLGDRNLRRWAEDAIADERARIENALLHLDQVCRELEANGCPTTVMKSLDHWPDLGNDLDLYTTAPEDKVLKVMAERLDAATEPRSWGDRIAQKWNFSIPGLRECIEIHVQRLGQMGEHVALARRFVTRRVPHQVNGYTFHIPAPEERIAVATLQRMYRHFYFRVCDIANTAELVESGAIDFQELRRVTRIVGIWPGVASYLKVVADYIREYRGTELPLPDYVGQDAMLGGDEVKPRNRFLRVPIMPHGAALYGRQVTQAALNGDVLGTFRLGLLPYLASAAALAQKITGSDKGVW